MTSGFDIAALDYDQNFTFSQIGTMQRTLVYRYVLKHLLNEKKLSILEVNCGTGEDAIWFSSLGHDVIATDASPEMVAIAQAKTNNESITFKQTKIQDLEETQQFDLIFSNFGGLNCLNPVEIKSFFDQARKFLKENGQIVLVIMPKNCLWDNLYHLFKGKWNLIGRRNAPNPVGVNVNGKEVETWYYNPRDIISLSGRNYNLMGKSPVGFFVPPSYMEASLKNKTLFLKGLFWLDNLASRIPVLARFSDHFLIHLKV